MAALGCRGKKAGVHVSQVFVNFFFSGWHVLGKKTLNDGVKPLVFAFYREVLAVACMAIVACCYEGTGGFARCWAARRHWCRLALLGVTMYVNVVGFVVGLVFTSATVAAVLQPAIPVFACGLAILAGQERLTWPKAAGLFLAVAGAVARRNNISPSRIPRTFEIAAACGIDLILSRGVLCDSLPRGRS